MKIYRWFGIGAFGLLLILVVIIFLFIIFIFGVVWISEVYSPKVGVINIHGTISYTDFGIGVANSRTIVQLIDDAEQDPSVVVILLDINSGGGDVVASKQIAYKVRNCSKPVVAYIGSVGASGAYYIASAADLVIADEDSLTGSIGVLMILENYHNLLEKVGVNMTTMKKGKYKDIANPFRNETVSPEEREILEKILDQAYSNFKRDLQEFRGDKLKSDISQIADGRPITGREAFELGLVDELGTREYAIQRAWELGGEEGEPEIKEFVAIEFDIFDLLSSFGYAFGKGVLSSMDRRSMIYYSS